MRNLIPYKSGTILLLVCAVLFVFNGAIFAQVTGKIAGKVLDSGTNEPLPGVNVQIQGTTMGGATDLEGDYYIINIPPGTYNLEASYVGYQSIVKTGVIVSSNNTTPIQFSLTATTLETEAISVVAEREIISMDQSSTTISSTAEEIVAVPLVENITDYIGLQAGIQGDIIRGGGLDQTTFTVDGLSLTDGRVNEPLFVLNLSSIKELNIIKGGFNAEYGNARSGVINVITKEGDLNYHGSVDFRITPARLKHSGASIFSPDNYYLRPYLDPAVMWTGTASGGWDALTQSQYPAFEGWDALSSRLTTDSDPSNDMTPEQARDLFLWRHRAEGSGALGQKEGTYGDKPDWNLDVSFSGPVPLLENFMGNGVTFFASYKTLKDMFGVPVSREFYAENNAYLKLTTQITPTMKFSVQGTYGEVNTVAMQVDETENNDYARSGADIFNSPIASGDAYGDRGGSNLYWPSSLVPFDIYRSMIGVSLDHALSTNTFYNLRISLTKVKDFAGGPDFWRDTTTVRHFGNVAVDEVPYGFWWQGGNKKMFDGMVYNAVGAGARDYSSMHDLNIRFDITSQMNKYNQVKAGILYNYDDFHTNYEKISQYSVNDEYKANWRYFPYRIGAYIQDKLEFEGMIANIGIRADYSNANADWFSGDPYSDYYSAKYKTVFTQIAPKTPADSKLRISPRLGISHPISANAKLYFSYGHFYSMPTSESMFNIRFGRAADGISYLGNPSADIPKTVAYELGFEYDLANMFLFHIAGYYKNVTEQTGSVSYTNFTGTVDYSTIENNNYQDIRGYEIRIDKRYGEWVSGWLNYNYILTTSGYVGRQHYYEDPRLQAIEGLQNPIQSKPLARPYARANLLVHSPPNWGPDLGGMKLLGDIHFDILFQWQAGRYVTWDPLETYQLQQNLQWKDNYTFDARISKKFHLGLFYVDIFADIHNLFNYNIISSNSFATAQDLRDYYESLHLPLYNGQEYKDRGYVGGNDKPGELRSADKPYINDPDQDFLKYLNQRFVTFGLKVEF